MWSFYLDGRRVKYGTYKDFIGRQLAKIEFASSGNKMKMLVSQFNLWDRVLTNQEIETFAKTCNQGIGNLLSWADLYDKSKKSRYVRPSSCKSAPEFLSTTASTTTDAPTTKVSPGKRVFLYKTKTHLGLGNSLEKKLILSFLRCEFRLNTIYSQ